MNLSRLQLSLVILLGLIASAFADVTVMLAPSVKNSARGREIVFSGSVTNNGASKVYLNDIASLLSVGSATDLPLNANSFFSNVPGVLLPGESYANDEVFRVELSSSAAIGDYRGTITIRGGDDIFANNSLAAGDFVVLSPALTANATDPSASEFGPDSGTVIVTRSGGTDVDLPVLFTTSGSAVAGVDYQSLPSSVIIPAGSSSIPLTVLPIPNNIAQGDRTTQITLSASSYYNLGAVISDTITIHDKPADAWRFEQFGGQANDPAAADAADWDGDGIPNLVEFAFDLDPRNGGVIGLPVVSGDGTYLTITFAPNPSATDVNFIVEGSPDLVSWSTSNTELVQMAGNNYTYRYKDPFSAAAKGFLRVRVERIDL